MRNSRSDLVVIATARNVHEGLIGSPVDRTTSQPFASQTRNRLIVANIPEFIHEGIALGQWAKIRAKNV